VKHLTTIAVAGLLAATRFPQSLPISPAPVPPSSIRSCKWRRLQEDTGVGLNYQSIGSGGGIKQITAKTSLRRHRHAAEPEDVAKNASFSSGHQRRRVRCSICRGSSGRSDAGRPTIAKIFSAKSPSGMIRRLPSSIRASSCPIPRLPCASLGRFGHHLHLDNYLSKVSPNGKIRSAKIPRSNGRSASAPKARRASPTTPQHVGGLGYVNMPMPSRTT